MKHNAIIKKPHNNSAIRRCPPWPSPYSESIGPECNDRCDSQQQNKTRADPRTTRTLAHSTSKSFDHPPPHTHTHHSGPADSLHLSLCTCAGFSPASPGDQVVGAPQPQAWNHPDCESSLHSVLWRHVHVFISQEGTPLQGLQGCAPLPRGL